MEKQILALSKKFISIPSGPDDRAARSEVLSLALAQLKGFTVERFERNGIKSALVYNSPKRPKKFSLILNGHLDIIPGKASQLIPRVRGNRLYGVGAMDMKANTAAMLFAFKDMAKKVNAPIGLQLVTDEEVGGFDGTQYQVEKGVRANFVIAGEPTNFDIVNKAKGVLWLQISAKGKTAHGAYPWRGDNAIWKINSFLNELQKKFPIPKHQRWVSTINLSTISTSNTAWNKIPDDCVVRLDIRYIPEDAKTIVQRVRNLVPKGLKVEVVANEPALLTDAKNPYLKSLQRMTRRILSRTTDLRPAQGSSDARHFARVNCPGVEFGPVGKGIGSDNEWVSIPSLMQYYNILTNYILELDADKK